jgi:hypothetical protein
VARVRLQPRSASTPSYTRQRLILAAIIGLASFPVYILGAAAYVVIIGFGWAGASRGGASTRLVQVAIVIVLAWLCLRRVCVVAVARLSREGERRLAVWPGLIAATVILTYIAAIYAGWDGPVRLVSAAAAAGLASALVPRRQEPSEP